MPSEKINWPNFYMVGAAKCGTTSLYQHLRRHPQIFLPSMKEPNFFTAEAPEGESAFAVPRCRSLEEYRHLYAKAQSAVAIGDGSNSYLWDENSPKLIREVSPEAKIIIMLRDPIERAHSFYLMNLRCGDDDSPTFQEALRRDNARCKQSWFTSWLYVEAGMYYAQVKRYFDTFGEGRVLLLLFDELAQSPRDLFYKIAHHLCVSTQPFESIKVSRVHNAYRMPRFQLAYRLYGQLGLRGKFLPASTRRWLGQNHLLFDMEKPQLDQDVRRSLQNVYDPDVTALEHLVGREFPELRKSWV